jgi:uncharacterized membrane-anchored protein YitT (DUF2179 family)
MIIFSWGNIKVILVPGGIQRGANMKRFAIIGPVFLMIISAAAVGFGFQLLLIPEKLLNSGLSGVAMVIGYLSGWNIG